MADCSLLAMGFVSSSSGQHRQCTSRFSLIGSCFSDSCCFSYLQIHGGFIALFVGSVRFVFKLTCRCYWIGCPDYTRLPLRICGGTASSAFAVPRFGSPMFCFASHRFSIVNPRHANVGVFSLVGFVSVSNLVPNC